MSVFDMNTQRRNDELRATLPDSFLFIDSGGFLDRMQITADDIKRHLNNPSPNHVEIVDNFFAGTTEISEDTPAIIIDSWASAS